MIDGSGTINPAHLNAPGEGSPSPSHSPSSSPNLASPASPALVVRAGVLLQPWQNKKSAGPETCDDIPATNGNSMHNKPGSMLTIAF